MNSYSLVASLALTTDSQHTSRRFLIMSKVSFCRLHLHLHNKPQKQRRGAITASGVCMNPKGKQRWNVLEVDTFDIEHFRTGSPCFWPWKISAMNQHRPGPTQLELSMEPSDMRGWVRPKTRRMERVVGFLKWILRYRKGRQDDTAIFILKQCQMNQTDGFFNRVNRLFWVDHRKKQETTCL